MIWTGRTFSSHWWTNAVRHRRIISRFHLCYSMGFSSASFAYGKDWECLHIDRRTFWSSVTSMLLPLVNHFTPELLVVLQSSSLLVCAFKMREKLHKHCLVLLNFDHSLGVIMLYSCSSSNMNSDYLPYILLTFGVLRNTHTHTLLTFGAGRFGLMGWSLAKVKTFKTCWMRNWWM